MAREFGVTSPAGFAPFHQPVCFLIQESTSTAYGVYSSTFQPYTMEQRHTHLQKKCGPDAQFKCLRAVLTLFHSDTDRHILRVTPDGADPLYYSNTKSTAGRTRLLSRPRAGLRRHTHPEPLLLWAEPSDTRTAGNGSASSSMRWTRWRSHGRRSETRCGHRMFPLRMASMGLIPGMAADARRTTSLMFAVPLQPAPEDGARTNVPVALGRLCQRMRNTTPGNKQRFLDLGTGYSASSPGMKVTHLDVVRVPPVDMHATTDAHIGDIVRIVATRPMRDRRAVMVRLRECVGGLVIHNQRDVSCLPSRQPHLKIALQHIKDEVAHVSGRGSRRQAEGAGAAPRGSRRGVFHQRIKNVLRAVQAETSARSIKKCKKNAKHAHHAHIRAAYQHAEPARHPSEHRRAGSLVAQLTPRSFWVGRHGEVSSGAPMPCGRRLTRMGIELRWGSRGVVRWGKKAVKAAGDAGGSRDGTSQKSWRMWRRQGRRGRQARGSEATLD
ncbi:hypothetical protein B0H11DRAFT_2390462 [Mycena galericulata]|nr:hypothetical protein B0H11DRAFT_2390462 [Mycena galericulata]